MMIALGLHYVVSQLILLLLSVSSQKIDFIDIQYATSFNGSLLTNSSSVCFERMLPGQPLTLVCTPGGSKLDDNITDGSLNDLDRFFAFTRQPDNLSTDGVVTFGLTAPTQNISSVIIHYYNSASESIGFPSISVTGSMGQSDIVVLIPFILSINDATNDPSIQSVVLQLLPSYSTTFVNLNFTFPDFCSIQWLLISEIQLNLAEPNIDTGSSVLSQAICPNTSLITVTNAVTSLTITSRPSATDSISPQTITNTVSTASSPRGITSSSQVIGTSSTITSSRSSSYTQSTSVLTLPPSQAGSGDNVIIPIGVAIGAIIVVIAICIVLFLIVCYSRKKQKMLNDLRNSGTSPRQGIELTNNEGSKDDEAKNELVYSVIVKKDKQDDEPPPAIPPQNFDPSEEAIDFTKENGMADSKNQELEWETTERPKLAKITNANNYKLVDNPVYDESAVYSSAGPYYSVANNPQAPAEAMYTEVPDKPSTEPVEAMYSTPEYFDLKNPIYDQADQYDEIHDQPFSFISSDAYSDGPIYSEPVIASNKLQSVTKIDSSSFQEIEELGMGQFGEVVYAKTIGLSLKDLGLSSNDDNKDISVSVAIKKVKVDANEASVVSFKKEMKFMSQLHHQNVVQLLAVSQDNCGPFMVMEYMENGDLNQFLLWHEVSHSHPPTEQNQLSPQNLLSMAIQIANGLTYLASHNYIHRDVATRNCLVGEDNIVKIADFGLSRSLYDSVYYRVKGKAKMPIRWMATECFYGKFSQFSDVWAYGVTVWEIYTMAREPPYADFDDQQVLDDALKKAGRTLLYKPASCPQEVYDCICSSCFVGDFKNRASFTTIHSRLLEVKRQLYV